MKSYVYLKVMYVEDDYDTRESLSRFLKRRFGKVITASSGEEGIKKYELYQPDIIIADIILPGMSGLEMMKVIRQKNPLCKYIITSMVRDVKTIIDAIDLKVENYILKPINTDELENKLEHIVSEIMRQRVNEAGPSFIHIIDKGVHQDNIRKRFLGLLKKHSGRGPRDVTVFITDDAIEITVFGGLTAMEKTLLRNSENISFVEVFRNLMYQCIKDDICNMIYDELSFPVKLVHFDINARKEVDFFTFSQDPK